MIRPCLIASVLLAACVTGCGRPAHEELRGAWQVSRIINNGQPAPEEELKGMEWVFAGDQLTMRGPGEGPDVVAVKLDPTREPREMDLTGPDTLRAIYKLEGKTLTIALPPRTAKPSARPTKFEFEPGSELSVIILKRP